MIKFLNVKRYERRYANKKYSFIKRRVNYNKLHKMSRTFCLMCTTFGRALPSIFIKTCSKYVTGNFARCK